MYKRIFASLLAFLMIIPIAVVLSGCTEGGSETLSGDTTVTDAGTTMDEFVNADGSYRYETDLKYPGETFVIYVNGFENDVWGDCDFSVEESSEDPVEDAVFRRILQAEDALEIDIQALPIGAWNGVDAALRTSLASDDGDFDAVMTNMRSAAALSREGLLLDLNDTELELNAPWWDNNSVADMSIDGKLYMTVGDITVMYKNSLRGIMFNKKLAVDYGLDDMYELAENNEWTVDRMIEMSRLVGEDLNNNGSPDADDLYGYVFFNDSIAINLLGAGVRFVDKDKEDIPYLSFYDQHTTDVWSKYIDFLYTDFASFNGEWYNYNVGGMWMSDAALFLSLELHSMKDFRQMETDFGILPTPLYDSEQERYYHTVNPNVAPALALPVNTPDTERATTVLDMLGCCSKNLLTPAYYDVYLTTKGTRDDESGEMLDIIFATVRYDVGYMYDWGGIGMMTPLMILNHKRDLVSEYTAIEAKVEREIDKAIDDYLKIGG